MKNKTILRILLEHKVVIRIAAIVVLIIWMLLNKRIMPTNGDLIENDFGA